MDSTTASIKYLVALLEDPDEHVYKAIASDILAIGVEAIPYLSSYLETTIDPLIIERCNYLINKIQFVRLDEAFEEWLHSPSQDIYQLLILLSQYFNHNNEIEAIDNYVSTLRRKIWLETNQFLTPLEQINVFVNILFKQNHIKDFKLLFKPEHSRFYFIDEIVKRQLGSELLIAIMYAMYFEIFEIPIRIVEVYPGKYYCAYISEMAMNKQEILCFIHCSYGEVFSYQDVISSLKLLGYSIETIKILDKKDVVLALFTALNRIFKIENNIEAATQIAHMSNKIANL